MQQKFFDVEAGKLCGYVWAAEYKIFVRCILHSVVIEIFPLLSFLRSILPQYYKRKS